MPESAGDRPRQGVRVQKISVTRPCHQLSVPDALSWTVTGALRHRWSLTYQRASEEGLKSELELRLESLCGWRRMRAAAPADPRISVRQVTLLAQLVYRAQLSGRAKNCRRSCRTRRERPRPVGVLVELVHCARRLLWRTGRAPFAHKRALGRATGNWTAWGGLGMQCSPTWPTTSASASDSHLRMAFSAARPMRRGKCVPRLQAG